MRIPPSVIVMSLLTAIPFGLAVKDTLAAKHEKASDGDLDDLMNASSEDRDRMLDEKFEKEMAEQRAQEAEQSAKAAAKRRTELKTLYGAEPATMGSKLARVTLGDSTAWPLTGEEQEDSDITLQLDRGNPYQATAFAGYGEACEELSTQLTTAWGPATTSVAGAGKLWVNDARHQNAFLDDSSSCELRFVQTTDVKTLFAKGSGLVPVALLGASADKLDRSVAHAPDSFKDDPQARIWQVPGIGKTSEPTRIEAGLDNNKVTSIVASGTTDDATYVALVAQLTSIYGGPSTEGDQLSWKRPRMSLTRTGQSWLLVVGG